MHVLQFVSQVLIALEFSDFITYVALAIASLVDVGLNLIFCCKMDITKT